MGCISLLVNIPYGVFTLDDTDSYTDTNTDRIGLYCYVKNSAQRSDTDTNACTNGNADGCCTQIGI